ncbi:MAG: multicopper oxidase domain-containing protein [Aigarchaeota archaeon]|nr:multicopper oxidase domain-containing protein [Aigarchaeota archaeon]MDW8093015.1 multicopper oxidase domain-containing protein [Nitrososphaerota archaeon]
MNQKTTTAIVVSLVLISVVVAVISLIQLQNILHGTEHKDEKGTRTITVYGNEYGYGLTPAQITSPGPTITVKVGEKVTLRLINVGELPHTLAVVSERRFDARALWGAEIGKPNIPIQPRGSASVTFIPDRPGTYYYVCTVPAHIELGMWGLFIVEG